MREPLSQGTGEHQRLSIRENARITFLVLPREAPSLAWRYLTDRSSFFEQGRP